jgi:hypothetical protein
MNMTTYETATNFPPKYLMRVNAPGGAGEFVDGDLALISRDDMPNTGDADDGTHLVLGAADLKQHADSVLPEPVEA